MPNYSNVYTLHIIIVLYVLVYIYINLCVFIECDCRNINVYIKRKKNTQDFKKCLYIFFVLTPKRFLTINISGSFNCAKIKVYTQL